ncbi:MAG: glycine zipper 2TM domain-containing protein [Thiobacillaceae bacterium]
MMKAKHAVPVILIAGFGACANSAMASDEVLGAILGGATGAVVGHAIGGHEGAWAGGAFGAVVGAAAASDRDDEAVYYGPPRAVYGPPAVVYAPPRVVYEEPIVYAPPPVVVRFAPAYYGYYGSYRWPGEVRVRGGHGHYRGW